MKFLFDFYKKIVNGNQGKEPDKDTNTRKRHNNNTSYASEHKRICKHRPNEDCTHYQKRIGKGTEYLKLENDCWSMLSKGEWWTLDSKLAKLLIENPVIIDKSIKKEFKYNWSSVPYSVRWIATNESGIAFGHESKPNSGYLHSGL